MCAHTSGVATMPRVTVSVPSLERRVAKLILGREEYEDSAAPVEEQGALLELLALVVAPQHYSGCRSSHAPVSSDDCACSWR